MTRIVAALLIPLFLPACTPPVYRAKLDDLRKAEERWSKAPYAISIPARQGLRKTYLDITQLRYVGEYHEGTGEADVVMTDRRPAYIGGGWALIAVGAGILAGTALGAAAECERRDRRTSDCVFATPFLQGVFYGGIAAVGGATLIIMGHVSDGPELDGPSREFKRYGLTIRGEF